MKNNLRSLIAVSGTIALLSLTVLPAFAVGLGINANTNASVTDSGTEAHIGVTVSAVLAQAIAKGQQRADQEITRRIAALNALSARVNGMAKLSASEKSSLSSSIQSQITLMNNLQAQIASDAQANSTTSLKTDIASITKAYRIFLLIIPQGAIEAASDRVMTIASDMTTLSGQLQARVNAANASGTNVSADQSLITEINAKIADANAQATAANSEVASLQPDNGTQTVQQSNTAALKDARAKIQVAQQDFVTARQDAQKIVKDLKISVSASASASTTAQ